MPTERLGMSPSWELLQAYETVVLSRAGGAARIELDRPDAMNAWDDQLPVDLADALAVVEEDPTLRALVITGRGRAFSAGADVHKLSSDVRDGSLDVGRSLRELSNPIVLRIRHMPKPVVAAVNGPAAGIGVSLALACDLVVAAESAFFLVAFTRIGLTPDGGASLFLAARLGHARASRLALRAERLPASDACEWGLIDQVVPDAEHWQVAEDLVQELANGPTRAYAATKAALHAALYPRLERQMELETQLQEELTGSADFGEGVTAFTGKRPPDFVGA
jgi:2-(1,2-epoxy-1,2-dihydrophenyl)acetyl-CoA isomerase